MGTVIVPRPEQCGTTAKTSECQRAGHKRRGSRGQGPRRSFLRLSPEKAGLPPGVGRETTSQVLTCAGPEKATSPPGWASWKERPPPATLCVRAFSYRKPGSPARDRAGNHLAGLDLRRSSRNPLPAAPPVGQNSILCLQGRIPCAMITENMAILYKRNPAGGPPADKGSILWKSMVWRSNSTCDTVK